MSRVGDEGPAVGAILDDLYRVERRLGEGSMGIVVGARDLVLQRDVAIKLIRSGLISGAELRERFLIEARAMARVNHPNVLKIFAFGDFEGSPYVVIELVEGKTLEEWLRELESAGVLPDIDVALRILDSICAGTQAIHDAKMIHRDLKPSNVLLDAGLRVRVADLGLAHLVRENKSAKREVVGTPSYMAPEIGFEREVAPELAPRADVYSLACMAYKLFTGHAPFERDTVLATIVAHGTEPVVPPSVARPELGAEFDAVIQRALAKDPADRTPSADAFRRELREARERANEPLRILLAEDDDDFREALTLALAHEFPSATIDAVANGALALRAFDALPHSVVVIDLQMPELDGMELTGLLRARDAAERVPIIVLTASGGTDEWKRLSAMGADGFLVKPVNFADVITLVRRALGERTRISAPPRAP